MTVGFGTLRTPNRPNNYGVFPVRGNCGATRGTRVGEPHDPAVTLAAFNGIIVTYDAHGHSQRHRLTPGSYLLTANIFRGNTKTSGFRIAP